MARVVVPLGGVWVERQSIMTDEHLSREQMLRQKPPRRRDFPNLSTTAVLVVGAALLYAVRKAGDLTHAR